MELVHRLQIVEGNEKAASVVEPLEGGDRQDIVTGDAVMP